jgi:hypothetical protein
MSTRSVQIRGASEIQQALRKWMEPELSKELDAATKAGANRYAKALRPELRTVSRRMARAVRVKRAKRDRPGWVVGSRRKVAFFWPFVIGGTRDHGPRKAKLLVWITPTATVRAARVRGVPANPIVERVAERVEAAAMAEADKSMTKSTGT